MSDSPEGKLLCFPCGGQDPAVYCELAKRWDLKDILILGWEQDGTFAWGGNQDQARELIWLLERAKWEIQKIVMDGE